MGPKNLLQTLLHILALAPASSYARPSANGQDKHVKLALCLAPEEPALLERTLYDISDPTHHRHGMFLSLEEAAALMQPSSESTAAVKQWLLDAGVPSDHIQDAGPIFHAHMPEAQAKTLLGLPSKDIRGLDARDLGTSLPDHLRRHVRAVHVQRRDEISARRLWPWPVVNSIQPSGKGEVGGRRIWPWRFGNSIQPSGRDLQEEPEDAAGRSADEELSPRSSWPWRFVNGFQPSGRDLQHHSNAENQPLSPPVARAVEADAKANAASHTRVDLAKCKNELTPSCLRKIYKMGDTNLLKPTKNIILGVAGFSGQTAQDSQLEAFLTKYANYAIGTKFSEEFVNGGTNEQGEYPSGEANLDMQYAVAMAHNLDVRYYSVGGVNRNFISDLDLADNTIAYIEPWLELATYLVSLPSNQLPSVLSLSYGENEQLLPRAYAQQVCDLFGQLGTRGVSILVAAGDAGPGQSCQSNDGSESVRFLPSFPASCPYVTAVGATEGNSPELAARFSGGGFSEYFKRPPYQDAAVTTYLNLHGDEWEGYYNRSGRAFPDIAALGKHYQIFNHGKIESADGTSASTPVVAAMIATLNALRAQKNKPALGFLNPWLYRIGPSAFTDITRGKSEGCPGTSYWGLPSPKVPGAGWPAAHGWDAVTGWGTPLFGRLRRLACF